MAKFNYTSNTFAGDKGKDGIEKFYTASGKWLTPYALACGYLEFIQFQKQNPAFPADIHLSLALDSGCFHVRAYDHTEHARLAWDTYRTLSEARAAFTKLKNKIIRDNAPRYEVQMSIGNGWENTWTDDAGENNPEGTPVTYATKTEAKAALNEFLRDTMQDYKSGNLAAPYSRSEFRIAQVTRKGG